ncbi:Mitochondrial ATPase complex subunit ATP10 [Lecanosticta acicola]|uniref:Mitochondrial ATPase complex subunit ATP10 n=1 Tax=Lecanosticta acicola TaxID=111012 RepID=A0AAI9EDR8_9PEZI|nr:Mitochondrial ATPase complex subunit ATP10 [Lecanosticta acicola]
MQAPSILCLRSSRSLACFTSSASRRFYASTPDRRPPPPRPTSNVPPPSRSVADSQPGYLKRSKQDDDEDFMPKPLSRPIGMPNPPKPGENMGLDNRSLAQRRDDFVDYDKHLERRSKMTKQISKPYFRDWSNLRFHKGKIFKSNERLFRGDVSLWFPNIYGKTLRKDARRKELERGDGYKGLGRNTCDVMHGKVSVVSIMSSVWAQAQVATFCSRERNPELHEALEQNKDVAQMVWINHETNFLKWWLLQMFQGSLRKGKSLQEQERYFMVRRGVSDVMKEAIGMLNDKVGYVYLVDTESRIRWAGSADAEPGERESLVKGLKRLVQEARTPKSERVDSKQQLMAAVDEITEETKAAAPG